MEAEVKSKAGKEVLQLYCPNDKQATLYKAAKHPVTGMCTIKPLNKVSFQCLLCSSPNRPSFLRFHRPLSTCDITSHLKSMGHKQRMLAAQRKGKK